MELTGNNKPEYGKKVAAEVSKRLEQEYGSGFDKTSISRMIKFYQEFPDFEKVATLSQQLTWSHFVEILPIQDELKRDFYAAMCMQENWSVRTLRERKKSMLYERTAISKKPEETIKNEIAELRDDGKMSLDLFYRDPYMLDFLGLRDTYSEKDLEYLLQNESVDFIFRNKEYHVEFAGADIYPQGFAAAFYRLQDFKGINMLVDIGNGTMNIMYINNSRPLEKKCFTEKYGTHQCVLAVRESLLKELGTVVDDLVIEQVIRTGTADIGEKYLTVIRKAAGDYTKEIFHKLREREYNPELMRLYVVGGGGCMIQNFGEYDKSRVTIVRDICATAKGYEAMTVRKIQRNGGMLV